MKNILLIFLLLSPLINTVFSEENVEGKLLSRVKYVFPLRLPGEIIELKKMLLSSGEIQLVSSSSEYDTMEKIRSLKREEEQLARQRYGTLRGELRGIYEFMSDQGSAEIEVFILVPLTEPMMQRFNLTPSSMRDDDYLGKKIFICTARKSNLAILAFDSDVIASYISLPDTLIFGGDEYYYDVLPMMTAEEYAKSAFMLPDTINDMEPYAKGQGVICATNESGIHKRYLDSLRQQYSNSTGGHINLIKTILDTKPWKHTHMTFGCMARTAPEGTWTHVSGDLTSVAKTYNTATISQSTHGNTDPEYISMMKIDTFIYNPAINPVFCNGAANDGVQLVTNWCCYNGISTGGSEYFNKEYFGIAALIRTGYKYPYYDWIDKKWCDNYQGTHTTMTQTRNPLPRSSLYAGIYRKNAVSDREMPNIVAPSTVSYRGCIDGIVYSKFTNTSGDPIKAGIAGCSAAAPTLNGVAASVISSDPSTGRIHMKNHPENVKTALMVTAVNIDGGFWNTLEDGRDGCGEVAGYDACIYVHDLCDYCFYGDTAEYGMSYGRLYSTAPPDTVLKYYIRIPDPLPAERHLRVMVNWSSSPGYRPGTTMLDENIISNLDLVLINCGTGKVAGACASFDDNIEVVDIYPAYKLNPGEIYRVEVRVIGSLVFPANPVADHIRYSVGWAWPLDYAGKTIAVRGSEENLDYRLLNRNLQIGPATINAGCNMNVSATNRITLLPGTKIDENANFYAKITGKEVDYSLENMWNMQDYSGNLRDAAMRGPINRDIDIYSQGRSGRYCFYFNGTDNYMIINNPGIKENPSPHTGLTAVFWMRWLPGMGMGGPILCATEPGTVYEGYSISINKLGGLQFCVGNSSAFSLLYYDIDSEDYYDGKYPANRGWTHIAAVWSAGEYMKLYVNGEEKECNTSSIVKTHSFPSDSMFLGKDWSNSRFKGSLGAFALFSGALADTTIKGLGHEHNWPLYQGATDHRSEVTIDIEGEGHIDLGVNFNDGYRYTNTITQYTVTSFPEFSELNRTVDFSFVPEGVGSVDRVVINGVNQGSITNRSYQVEDTEDGKIEVYFNP